MSNAHNKFQFPGITPFCIEMEKTVSEIDNEIKAGQSYAGSFYPIGVDLQTFSKLYWRMKEISWTYRSDDQTRFCAQGTTPQNDWAEIDGSDKNILLNWIENPPSDSLDSLNKRICDKKLWDIEIPISWTSFSYKAPLHFFDNPYDAPKVIAEFNGGNSNDMNNYTYYPFFNFSLIGGYWLNWSTAKRLWIGSNCSEIIEDSDSVNLQINGESVGSFEIFRTNIPLNCLARCDRTYTHTFGNFNIHLWDLPPTI